MLKAEAAFESYGYRETILVSVQNILIVRLDIIGDMVLTSEFLREVRANFPQARISLVYASIIYPLVEICSYVKEKFQKCSAGQNVASGMTPLEKNPDAAPYSMETLAEQNPEIIFVTSMGDAEQIKSDFLKTVEQNSAWQAIGAIKDNRLYFLPQDLFLLSPGLRYPEAVKTMAQLIYPKKF